MNSTIFIMKTPEYTGNSKDGAVQTTAAMAATGAKRMTL